MAPYLDTVKVRYWYIDNLRMLNCPSHSPMCPSQNLAWIPSRSWRLQRALSDCLASPRVICFNQSLIIVDLSDLLGSTAFAVVQSDLKGNIVVSKQCDLTDISHRMWVRQKVRARYDAVPDQCATLESLVKNEASEKKRPATEGLMWLLRGLSFTCKSLQNLQANKEEELTTAFSSGYDSSLKKHHNFVVKGLFAVSALIHSDVDDNQFDWPSACRWQ